MLQRVSNGLARQTFYGFSSASVFRDFDKNKDVVREVVHVCVNKLTLLFVKCHRFIFIDET